MGARDPHAKISSDAVIDFFGLRHRFGPLAR
jgi:hypothetical protein